MLSTNNKFEMVNEPKQRHKVQLNYEGEIRFGPPYFKLVLDQKELRNRIFGDVLAWSQDHKYLAAQEWLTLNHQEWPLTRVLLIDTDAGMYSEFRGVKGLVKDFKFVEAKFIYIKDFMNDNGIEAEVDIEKIQNWKKFSIRASHPSVGPQINKPTICTGGTYVRYSTSRICSRMVDCFRLSSLD